MKKIYLLVYLLFFSFLLSGCWDLDENERMFYVFGAGLDYKDGLYEVSLQIISFSNVAKSEQTNQDVIQSEVNTFTGITPDEAFSKTYNALDEKVYWGHFSFIIFGENILKKNKVDEMLNDITRYTDTRYNTWVYTTDEPLKDFLIVSPLLKRSITLTKIADPMNSFEQLSYIEPLSVRKLIISINEPNHEVNIPYIRLRPGWKSQKEENDKTIEMGGVGVMSSQDGLKGYLKDTDADGLKWLSNETISGRVTSTFDNNTPFSVTARDVKSTILPIIEGNNIKFDINVNLTVNLGSFSGYVTPDDIRKSVSKQIEKEIKDTYKKGLEIDVDIYGLSTIAYRKDLKFFRKLDKNGKLELTEESIRNININVQKVDSGRKSFEEVFEK